MRTQASIDILELMLKDYELTDNDRKEILNRIEILNSMEILHRAVEQYKNIFNIYPSTLDELVKRKIIDRLPENPYLKKYTYHPDTGEIKFD
jgi:hypothetical protein